MLKTRPKYEPPKVLTYQEDEILKQMGPVGGCTSQYGAAPMDPFEDHPRRRDPGKRSRRYRSSLYEEDHMDDIYDEDEEDI